MAKNSTITSSGMPLVSGTFTKTMIHAMKQKSPKKKANVFPIPRELSKIGKSFVTKMLVIHMAAWHIPVQTPLTLVGNISAHSMFGIGPNPVTKNITYTMTLKTETTAKMVSLVGTRLMIMRERRASTRIGSVVRRILLQ